MLARFLALSLSLALAGTAAAGGPFQRRPGRREAPSTGASAPITSTVDGTLVIEPVAPAPSALPSEQGDISVLRIDSDEMSDGRVVSKGRIINHGRRGFSVLHLTPVAQEVATGAVIDDGGDLTVTSFGPGAQVEFAVHSQALHRYRTLGPDRCRLFYRRGASRVIGGSPIPADRTLYRFKGTPRLRD